MSQPGVEHRYHRLLLPRQWHTIIVTHHLGIPRTRQKHCPCTFHHTPLLCTEQIHHPFAQCVASRFKPVVGQQQHSLVAVYRSKRHQLLRIRPPHQHIRPLVHRQRPPLPHTVAAIADSVVNAPIIARPVDIAIAVAIAGILSRKKVGRLIAVATRAKGKQVNPPRILLTKLHIVKSNDVVLPFGKTPLIRHRVVLQVALRETHLLCGRHAEHTLQHPVGQPCHTLRSHRRVSLPSHQRIQHILVRHPPRRRHTIGRQHQPKSQHTQPHIRLPKVAIRHPHILLHVSPRASSAHLCRPAGGALGRDSFVDALHDITFLTYVHPILI